MPKFTRKNKSSGSSALNKIIAVLPQVSLDLQKSYLSEWQLKDKLIEQENVLKRLGLIHHGYFATCNDYAVIRLSLWCYEKSVIFVCYEVDQSVQPQSNLPPAFSFECIAKLSNSGSICLSNSESEDLLPRQNNHLLFKTDLNDPEAVLNAFQKRIPSDLEICPIKDVTVYFCESYEQHSEWLWREQQLRSDKVVHVMKQLKIKPKNKLLNELISHGKILRSELRIKQITRKLATSSKMPETKWRKIRDKMVIIHNDMTGSELANAICRLIPDITDLKRYQLKKYAKSNQKTDGIGEFTRLAKKLNIKCSTKRIAKIRRPVKAEVYLSP